MIKRWTFLLMLGALFFSTNVEAQKLKGLLNKAKEVVTGEGGALSKEDVGNGLKEALNIGVGEAVDFLSVEDGYYKSPYKILMPTEAEKVMGKLRAVPGFSNIEADILEKINRAAEDAATKADKFKARETWKGAVTAHNKLPFVKKAKPELDDYVAKQALIGMFGLVEKKEGNIRQDVGARPSPLLQKVFAQQDN